MIPLPDLCVECPLARHISDRRFSCGKYSGLSTIVHSKYPATNDCHKAVINRPDRYYQPPALPDFKELTPELICTHISLSLNWLDPDDREFILVTIRHDEIGYIKEKEDKYYCDRLQGIDSSDPYAIALQMVHPDYLSGVVDEIIHRRGLVPDYF